MPLNPLVFNPLVNQSAQSQGYKIAPAQQAAKPPGYGKGGAGGIGGGIAGGLNALVAGYDEKQKLDLKKQALAQTQANADRSYALQERTQARADKEMEWKEEDRGDQKAGQAALQAILAGKSPAAKEIEVSDDAPEFRKPEVEEPEEVGTPNKVAKGQRPDYSVDDAQGKRRKYQHLERVSQYDQKIKELEQVVVAHKGDVRENAQNSLDRLQRDKELYQNSEAYKRGSWRVTADRLGLKGGERTEFLLNGKFSAKTLERVAKDEEYKEIFSRTVNDNIETMAEMDKMLGILDENPDAVGLNQPIVGGMGWTDAGEIRTFYDMIAAKATFTALADLKARGISLAPITEQELKTARQSVMRADPNQNMPAFKRALKEYRAKLVRANKFARYHFDMARFRSGDIKRKPKMPGLEEAIRKTDTPQDRQEKLKAGGFKMIGKE